MVSADSHSEDRLERRPAIPTIRRRCSFWWERGPTQQPVARFAEDLEVLPIEAFRATGRFAVRLERIMQAHEREEICTWRRLTISMSLRCESVEFSKLGSFRRLENLPTSCGSTLVHMAKGNPALSSPLFIRPRISSV